MDTIMAAKEHVALARSLFELGNHRQSDSAWLEKCMAAFAADCEVIDVPSGTTLHGTDGYKRIVLFFVENFPDGRVELTNVFATEEQVVVEGTWRWNDTGHLPLPAGTLPNMRRAGELRCCFVLQISKGKITSFRQYYDMLTQMEQLALVPAWGQATE